MSETKSNIKEMMISLENLNLTTWMVFRQPGSAGGLIIFLTVINRIMEKKKKKNFILIKDPLFSCKISSLERTY